MLVPLSVLGGIGNGYANVGASTLLVTRTPDAELGRVSAAATAAVGGAQGVSLLAGGAVAAVLSPREIYALAADCSAWASRSPSPSSTPPGQTRKPMPDRRIGRTWIPAANVVGRLRTRLAGPRMRKAHEPEPMSAEGRQALARGLRELAGRQVRPPRMPHPGNAHVGRQDRPDSGGPPSATPDRRRDRRRVMSNTQRIGSRPRPTTQARGRHACMRSTQGRSRFIGTLQITPMNNPPGLAIGGEIDEDAYPALVEKLGQLARGRDEVHVDLAAVQYCDLAGSGPSSGPPPQGERWCCTGCLSSCRRYWASSAGTTRLGWWSTTAHQDSACRQQILDAAAAYVSASTGMPRC
jgi:hypothetical protein